VLQAEAIILPYYRKYRKVCGIASYHIENINRVYENLPHIMPRYTLNVAQITTTVRCDHYRRAIYVGRNDLTQLAATDRL